MTLPDWLKNTLQNKYVAVTILALLWATFIHDLGLPFVIREARSLAKNKAELSKVLKRNAELEAQQAAVLYDAKEIERHARETYFMKRAGEDVFRIED